MNISEFKKTLKVENMKVEFVKDLRFPSEKNAKVDGLYSPFTHTLSIEANLKTLSKLSTLGHESLHFLSSQAFSLEARPIIDLSIDYLNFLVQPINLKAIIKAKYGPRKLIQSIRNRIKYFRVLKETYQRIFNQSCRY